MDNKNLIEYDLFYNATENLKNAVSKQDWSDANTKRGYLKGLQAMSDVTSKTSQDFRLFWANENLSQSIKTGNFGDAAYWEAVVKGMKAISQMLNR